LQISLTADNELYGVLSGKERKIIKIHRILHVAVRTFIIHRKSRTGRKTAKRIERYAAVRLDLHGESCLAQRLDECANLWHKERFAAGQRHIDRAAFFQPPEDLFDTKMLRRTARLIGPGGVAVIARQVAPFHPEKGGHHAGLRALSVYADELFHKGIGYGHTMLLS